MNEYLTFATSLAYEAGEIMLKYFTLGIEKEFKDDHSPVTIADKQINALVVEKVNKTYPTHSILGEEQSDLKDGSEYTWVCDPIDGTIAYTLSIPTNVFSLALVKNGEVQLGVVYDPYLKRLYSAVKDKGAYLNDTPIHVNDETDITLGRIGTSGPSGRLLDLASFHAAVERNHLHTIHLTCAIYEGVLVASGQLIGNVFSGNTAHDAATLKIIVEEAGGKVTDLWGNDQRYDRPIKGLVVSNGRVHGELLDILRPHLA